VPGILNELLQSLSDKAFEHSSEGLRHVNPDDYYPKLLSKDVSPKLDLQRLAALRQDKPGIVNDAIRFWRDKSPDTLRSALETQGHTPQQADAAIRGGSLYHPLYQSNIWITPEDLQAQGDSAAAKGIATGAVGGGVLGALGGTAARQVGKHQRKKKASVGEWVNQLVDQISSGEQTAAGPRNGYSDDSFDSAKSWKLPDKYLPVAEQFRDSFGTPVNDAILRAEKATGGVGPGEWLRERMRSLTGGRSGAGHRIMDPETGELRDDLHWREESADTLRNMTRMGLGAGVAGGGAAGLLTAYAMPKAVSKLRDTYRAGKGHAKAGAVLDPFFDWVGEGGADAMGHVVGERAPLIPWAMRHFPAYAGMKMLETGAQLLPPAFLTGTIGYGLGKKILGKPAKTLFQGVKEKIKHRVKQSNILQDILPDAFQGIDQDALGGMTSDITQQAEAAGMTPPPSMMPDSRGLALLGILAPMSAGASGTLLMKKLMDRRKKTKIAWMMLADPAFAKQAGALSNLVNRTVDGGKKVLSEGATAMGLTAPLLAMALGYGRGPQTQLPPRQIRQPSAVEQPAPAKVPMHAPAPGDM